MVPSDADIRRWHGAASVSRSTEGSQIDYVEAIVAEEEAVFTSQLLINARSVVIGIVHVRARYDGVKYRISGKVWRSIVGLEKVHRGCIEAGGRDHIRASRGIRAGRIEIGAGRIR